ncbi:NfeD family protein [Streptomyces pseudogriseolus]
MRSRYARKRARRSGEEPGTTVDVIEISGATAIVYPRD